MTRTLLSILTCVALLGLAPARAQEPPPSSRPGAGFGPGEVVKLFEAYAIVEAQESLALDDAQYARFVSRFKALQAARRDHFVARTRLVRELARLGSAEGAAVDEAGIRQRLKALDELDVRAQADIRKAGERVDEVLTVQQQAKFRAFEELLERRKFDLMSRARQAVRPPGARRPGGYER